MKTYTLHLRDGAVAGDPEALETALLVKDGFSFGAFAFSFLWFFAHRLWLAGLAVLAAAAGLAALLWLFGVGRGAGFAAELLLALLVGLEANSLRRWTLARHGRPAVDAVSAASRDEAEMKSFSRWLAGSQEVGAPARAATGAPAPYRAGEPVIGLFPETERVR
jgi:ABC-type Fe3+-siderophore transport system permease subunit